VGPVSDAAWTRERCEELDRVDPLRHVRGRFFVPEDLVYLDGNSLGVLPKAVPQAMAEMVSTEWGVGLVGGWDRWISAPNRVGDKIARLIGAGEGEVVVIDTTTIALVKLLGAALAARPGRRVIVTTQTNFPTDLYAIGGIARLLGDVEVRMIDAGAVAGALDEGVAATCLTHVDFRTGAMFDMAALTAAAHDVGALAIWDLCHSVGAVVVDLERDGVDLAAGCCYKYLNGGPGAPAFIYIRRELQELVENPLPGWLGHEAPFDFAPRYRPAPGIRRFVTSTPPILGIAALDAALDAWDGVTVDAVRAKSVAMSELFISAVTERLGSELQLASPTDSGRRGSQVSLRHEQGYSIVQALIARGVIGDFRAPDLCRFGFTPLYLRYVDVFDAVEHLVAVMESKEYTEERFAAERPVT
jgi:kynureninase